MRCVQGMSVAAETEQGLRRLTATRTFTCCPSVSRHCWVSCASCLMFLWILVFTLSLVSDVYTSTLFHHAYAIPSTKFFLLDVVVRLCPVIVNSICIPNSCIFHISKTGLLRCCLDTPVGYSRPPSTVNDLSVTK